MRMTSARAPVINRGIVEGATRGVVTSASVMVDMPAAEQLAALRDAVPQLSIGMHATLTSEGGELTVEPRRCRQELERQLDRFEALLGRGPDAPRLASQRASRAAAAG